MPEDAYKLKVNATKCYGAKVDFFNRNKGNIDALISNYVENQGMTYISPYDNYDIIAGQGTAALELFEEVGELDHLFIGVGGGGLISGCSLVAKSLYPNCKIHGVEPQASNDAKLSLQEGKIVKIKPPQTIADGAKCTRIGNRNFKIMKRCLDDVVLVTD